jgi:hypothetical protein
VQRDEVREACWTLASQGWNFRDENPAPTERVERLAEASPDLFLQHLESLIGEAQTTEDASYLYRDAVATIARLAETSVGAACERSPRFAYVAYDGLELLERELLKRVLTRELVVRTWVAYHQHRKTESDEFWAWSFVSDSVDDPDDEQWSLMRIERAANTKLR